MYIVNGVYFSTASGSDLLSAAGTRVRIFRISAFTQKCLRILYRDSSFRPVHYQHNASSESSNSAMRDSASAPWSSAMRSSALRFNHLDTWICCDGAISSTVISLRFLLCSQSDMVSEEISISLYWTLFRFCCLDNHCQKVMVGTYL